MKILVTGVAGFLASHLAEALLEEGHEVWGIDNLTTGRRDNVPAAVHFSIGDIRHPDDLPVSRFDVIYHAAASYKDRHDWERDSTTNVVGTVNVLRAAQKSDAKLVYFQTSLCYGPNPISPITPLAPLDPRGSYAVSKTAGETYIRDAGISYVSLRLANIYGPRNLSGPAPAFYQRLSKGQECTVVDSRRDFVYVDDLVAVAVKAATKGQGVYHVSTGADMPIIDIYNAVAKAMGIDPQMPFLQPRGTDDVATLLLDPAETAEEFAWTARTPLIVGIREAVAWYQSHPATEVFTHLAMKG